MKRQVVIIILTVMTLANISLAQATTPDPISEFLKNKQNGGSNMTALETQAQLYFNAIINRDAEGIYKFMNPAYAQKLASKTKALEMIRDEFKLMDSDNLKIVSIKIKPDSKKSINTTSTQKIGIDVEVADLNGKDAVTVDGELTAMLVNNNWYYYHKNYYINSLEPYGMVRAVDEETEPEPKNVSQPNPGNAKIYSGGMINGQAISLPAPEYPGAARAVGVTGSVNVEVIVDEEGNVISATAISGHPLLKSAAVDAAKKAKFKPTIIEGQVRKISGIIVYNFKK